MGARAGNGIEIDVAKVPQRETGMTAYEVMLSESQERMLLVAERGREREIIDVFEKWDLHAEAIGTVTADKRLRIFKDGVLEADVPNEALTDEAPLYDRPWVDARQPGAGRGRARRCRCRPTSGRRCAALLASPTIANKRWIYRQYDSTVRTNTMVGPGRRRGGRAHQGHEARAGDGGRRQRPLRLARPERGRAADGRRGLPQRGRVRRACRSAPPTA